MPCPLDVSEHGSKQRDDAPPSTAPVKLAHGIAGPPFFRRYIPVRLLALSPLSTN